MPTIHPDPAHDRAPTGFRFGAFELDLARRDLRREGHPVEMPARVFELLECLLVHRDRAVGRDELVEAVFRRPDVSDGQLAQVVLRARRCVGDDGQAQHTIQTVPRFGFRWAAPAVAVVEPPPPAPGPAPAPAVSSGARPPPRDTRPGMHGDPAPSGTVAPETPRTRYRHPVAWAVVAVLLAILAALAWRGDALPDRPRQAHALSAGKAAIVVMPLDVASDGGEVAWVRLGLMDYVAGRVRSSGQSVPPSETTLALLGDGTGAGTGAAGLRIALPGAVLVDGEVRRSPGGDGWQVRLQARPPDGPPLHVDAEAPDLLPAAARATDRLLAALGHAGAAGAADGPQALGERLQRVRAALLANELDTARRILEDAPPEQLSQPELRFHLAQVDYRAGEVTNAERTFSELLETTRAADDPLFRARLLAYRGGARIRRDALDAAIADYDSALAALAGVAPGAGDLEHGAVRMGRGVALAGLGRDEAAVADFGAARSRLQRAGDRLAVARVDANLGALELGRGRPAQALDHLGQALAVFEASTALNERLVTLSALSASHLDRLDPAAALATTDRVQPLLPKAHDPALRLAAALDRANALVALGRLSEARALLAAPAVQVPSTPPYERRRAETLVELAWQAGEHRTAVAIADAILAGWHRRPGDVLHDQLRLRRAQAAAAADLPPAPATRIESVRGPTPALILADAVELGPAPAAGPRFEAALASAEARGTPAGIVDVAAAYVPWLLEHGRVREAEALVGRVSPWRDRCYACARLQLALAEATGDTATADEARRVAARLAGERTLPQAQAQAPVMGP